MIRSTLVAIVFTLLGQTADAQRLKFGIDYSVFVNELGFDAAGQPNNPLNLITENYGGGFYSSSLIPFIEYKFRSNYSITFKFSNFYYEDGRDMVLAPSGQNYTYRTYVPFIYHTTRPVFEFSRYSRSNKLKLTAGLSVFNIRRVKYGHQHYSWTPEFESFEDEEYVNDLKGVVPNIHLGIGGQFGRVGISLSGSASITQRTWPNFGGEVVDYENWDEKDQRLFYSWVSASYNIIDKPVIKRRRQRSTTGTRLVSSWKWKFAAGISYVQHDIALPYTSFSENKRSYYFEDEYSGWDKFGATMYENFKVQPISLPLLNLKATYLLINKTSVTADISYSRISFTEKGKVRSNVLVYTSDGWNNGTYEETTTDWKEFDQTAHPFDRDSHTGPVPCGWLTTGLSVKQKLLNSGLAGSLLGGFTYNKIFRTWTRPGALINHYFGARAGVELAYKRFSLNLFYEKALNNNRYYTDSKVNYQMFGGGLFFDFMRLGNVDTKILY